jgi:hypothetical protein
MPSREPSVAEQRARLRWQVFSQVLVACSLTISLALRIGDDNWLPWTALIGAVLVACLAYIAFLVHQLRQLATPPEPRDIDQQAD